MTNEERALRILEAVSGLSREDIARHHVQRMTKAFREVERSARASEREKAARVVRDEMQRHAVVGKSYAALQRVEAKIKALPDDPDPETTT